MSRVRSIILTALLIGQCCLPIHAASIKESLQVVSKSNQDSIDSQHRIDRLAVQTQAMLEEYQQILHNTAYQDAYNAELQNLKTDQEAELTSLRGQLNDIKVTQMRIVPLLRSMADALEKFVVLDLPFHFSERVNAVVQLQERLRAPSLSVPDKYRLVLEAFQIENDYGRSVEAYRDTVVKESETLSVEYLRIGRVAFYYQTLDSKQSAYWDTQTRQWHPLPASYNDAIKHALRVAKNQLTPQLFSLPMINDSAAGERQ